MTLDQIDTKLHSIDEVAKMLRITTSTKKLERHAREHGHCHVVFDTVMFSEADIAGLLESFSVKPPKKGPLRMLGEEYEDDEDGYVVFIGYPMDQESPVYVGFCPDDDKALADLVKMVQFGCPEPVSILAHGISKFAQVKELRQDYT